MMRILNKSRSIFAVLLLIMQLFVPLTQVRAEGTEVTDQLTFYKGDQQLSGKDVTDKLEVKAGETAILTLKRKDKEDASEVKIALPEFFVYEKDDAVKANQELLDKSEGDWKKAVDAEKVVEEKEEDDAKYLQVKFVAGQGEVKLALKGIKEGSGQLLATYKVGEQEYSSYPVSSVVSVENADGDAEKASSASSSSNSSASSSSSEKAEEESTEEQSSASSASSAASSSSKKAESIESSQSSAKKDDELISDEKASDEKSSKTSSSTATESKKTETSSASTQTEAIKSTTVAATTSAKLPFTARMLKSQLAVASTAVTSEANVDLVINSDSATIESGKDALYTVNFKVSGSRYDEASRWPITLTFSLKNTADNHLRINTDTVPTINGVTPTVTDDKVTYTFTSKDQLQAGQAYTFRIAVNTDNGYLNKGTAVDLQGQFTDAMGYQKSASASTQINANTSVAISKSFLGAKNAKPNTAPGVNDTLAWRISFSVENKDGMRFLDPSKKIVFKDYVIDGQIDSFTGEGLTYTNKSGNSVTYEMDTPSIAEQKQNLDAGQPIVTKSFIVYTKPHGRWTMGQTVTNKADVTVQNLQGETWTKDATATGIIGKIVPGDIKSSGTTYYSSFKGPTDGEGHYGNQSYTTVYDTANLTYRSMVATGVDGKATTNEYNSSGRLIRSNISSDDFNMNKYMHGVIPDTLLPNGLQKSVLHYDLNEHLIIKSFDVPEPKMILYTTESWTDYPAGQVPGILTTLKVKDIKTGSTRTITKYLTKYGNIPISYFDLTENERVLSADFSIQYENTSQVISAKTAGEFMIHAGIEKGYVGKIKVTTKLTVVAKDGTTYTHESPNNTRNDDGSYFDLLGPREVEVIQPGSSVPIAKIDTAFKKTAAEGKGVIDKNTSNRVQVDFYNLTSSQSDMTAPVVFNVLLPKGVTPASNLNYKMYLINDKTGEEQELTFGNGNWVGDFGYSYHVKGGADVYPGQKYVKFVYNQKDAKGNSISLKPGYHLRGEVDVEVGNVSGDVTLTAYGGSYTHVLTAPTGYEIEKDLQESEVSNGEKYLHVKSLLGDGNIKQAVKGTNTYKLSTYDQVKIKKSVKGSEDSDYGQMAHTTPGGTINYRLQITAGQQVDKLTLMDVLPSVGDYGVTDNVDRESKFTPVLTGPINVSGLSGATIKYSTATNPSRSVLNNSITWPNGGTKLVDKNAENPTWLTANQVTDWSKIHSFLITSGTGTIKTGQTATLDFTMQAPKIADMTQSQLDTVLDQSIAENKRAAWNSFAVTANNLMPVEPERVGVVLKDAGVRILKKANLTNENLTGVKFKLADSEANAKAGKFLRIKDGKVLAPTDSGYSSASDYEATSKDGVVQFHGLTDGKTYYAVETEALSGYQLDSTPHAVVASYTPSSKQITVYNHRDIILPKTGSSWMALFLIVGISGIAAGFYLSRKKKERN